MIPQESLLILLVRLIDRIPAPPAPKAGRGHPKVYPDRLFLKALVIMIVRHLHKVHELLSVLEQPTAEMQILRGLLTENSRYPARRTWVLVIYGTYGYNVQMGWRNDLMILCLGLITLALGIFSAILLLSILP